MNIFDVPKPKKASLSLSVNAIVVLVLGITMLGLGLAFTKGMFAKLKGKLEIPPPNIPATADEPIVLPNDEVEISGRKTSIVSINVYNDGGPQLMDLGFTNDGCTEASPDDLLATELTSIPQNVPSDSFKTFKITVDPTGSDGFEGSCLFTIEAILPNSADEAVASKQITFKAS